MTPEPTAQAAAARLPPIVCAISDLYVRPLCVVMRSLAAAHAEAIAQLRMIVLHSQFTQQSRRTIQFHADQLGLSVEFRLVADVDGRYPIRDRLSNAVYLRLSIPEAIGDEAVVLYLDADVLVLDDLRPLLLHVMAGAPLAAVRDPENPMLGLGVGQTGWQELGLPSGREYFNSGVILLDLDKARRLSIFERAAEFLHRHPAKARLMDQDALNWAADDNWARLDRRWNTFALSPITRRDGATCHLAESVVPLAQLLADEDSAAILHYACADKPWHPDYPPGRPRDLYQQFLNATILAERTY